MGVGYDFRSALFHILDDTQNKHGSALTSFLLHTVCLSNAEKLNRLLTSGSGYPKISSRVLSTRTDLSDDANEIRCTILALAAKDAP